MNTTKDILDRRRTNPFDEPVDRTGWDPGPWDDEPDQVSFTTRAGYPGHIARTDLGSLCGYVALPEDHPCFGKDYDDAPHICVHGGLTYSGRIPKLEPAGAWWIGFDCAHAWDLLPARTAWAKAPGWPSYPEAEDRLFRDVYRTMDYVRREVGLLAGQLRILASRRGASLDTLWRRVRYGGKKGRRAARRLVGR